MSGHISWIEHCWCIWSHTGQKCPHSSVLVFYCFSQPQLLQIRTGPFPEGKCFHQLRGLRRFSFVSSPFFNYHRWNYKTAMVDRKHSELKSSAYLKLCMQEILIQKASLWDCNRYQCSRLHCQIGKSNSVWTTFQLSSLTDEVHTTKCTLRMLH